MYNVLPPSRPVDPFDRHGRLHFLAHGIVIGISVSAAVPGLPQWLTSVLGAQIIAWSALGFAVSLVLLKLAFCDRWKTAASLLFILTGGIYLGSIAHSSDVPGAGLGGLVAAVLVLGGLSTIYHESRQSRPHADKQTGKTVVIRLTDPGSPVVS